MNPQSDQDDAALDERYRRLVRRARWRRAVPVVFTGAAVYLPLTKGEVRFLGLEHLSWPDAVEKTIVWALIMGFIWVLPFDAMPRPSGYLGLARAQRARVDEALRTGRVPTDPFLRRVADARAAMLMQRGEPGRQHAICLGLAAVVVCGLAAQWWVLVLWLGVIAYAAIGLWKRRGLATQAEQYLTAPRRFVSRERMAELFKDAPSIDAAAFRHDMDELADQDPFPRG